MTKSSQVVISKGKVDQWSCLALGVVTKSSQVVISKCKVDQYSRFALVNASQVVLTRSKSLIVKVYTFIDRFSLCMRFQLLSVRILWVGHWLKKSGHLYQIPEKLVQLASRSVVEVNEFTACWVRRHFQNQHSFSKSFSMTSHESNHLHFSMHLLHKTASSLVIRTVNGKTTSYPPYPIQCYYLA